MFTTKLDSGTAQSIWRCTGGLKHNHEKPRVSKSLPFKIRQIQKTSTTSHNHKCYTRGDRKREGRRGRPWEVSISPSPAGHEAEKTTDARKRWRIDVPLNLAGKNATTSHKPVGCTSGAKDGRRKRAEHARQSPPRDAYNTKQIQTSETRR